MNFYWWCLQESNQGHKDFQSFALPTELRHHALLGDLLSSKRVQIYSAFYFLAKEKQKKSFRTFAPIFAHTMNLVIDIGNTFIKLAVFQKNTLQEKILIQRQNFSAGLQNIFNEYHKSPYKIDKAILSSVAETEIPWPDDLQVPPNLLILVPDTPLPFINRYKSPQTLGNDRKALVAAAAQQYPDSNVLVIDAGTCITYDFKNEQNEYLGGGISPGLQMRYNAMHHFTARLPKLEPVAEVNLIGDSTENSMHSGVVLGMAHEIDGLIAHYQREHNSLKIILTGGDAHFLSLQLKNTIFASSNFLVEGLNHILEFNNIS